MPEHAIPAVAGQYVRRINTATIGYIAAQFFETPNKVDIMWNEPKGWFEIGVFLSELVACDEHGDEIGYLVWPHGEPWKPDRKTEKAAPILEDGPIVSGSPEVTESHSDNDLRRWWLEKAAAEVDPMVAKMAEYGGDGRAIDLFEIGRTLNESGVVHQFGSDDEDSDAWQAELGIYFYLVGKFARWKAAVQEGRKVSDDTLLDIGIYIRMAQRIRDVGGWPK